MAVAFDRQINQHFGMPGNLLVNVVVQHLVNDISGYDIPEYDYSEYFYLITVPDYSRPEMASDVLLLTEPMTQPTFKERIEPDAPVDIEITASDRYLIRGVTA